MSQNDKARIIPAKFSFHRSIRPLHRTVKESFRPGVDLADLAGRCCAKNAAPRRQEETMLKALPFLWFLLAALGAAAQLFVARMAGGDAMGTMLISAASTVLITTVSTIGMALVYLLILRTRPSLSVAIIGYSHFFLASAAYVGQTVGTLERNRYLSGTGDMTAASFAYTASGLANLLAGIVFILALIVALNTRHERLEDIF
ncbi:hypothetical protein HY26_13225 [Hyphomonas sp. GM-8P]|nr:hypothetical protein HY26_13225 [Hyphomonas sp. GM-8P]